MKKLALSAIILVIIFFDFAQENSTIVLNTNQNLFSANEPGVVKTQRINFSDSNEAIRLFVDTITTCQFEFRSDLFPPKLVIDTLSNGSPDTSAFIGLGTIEAFEVTISYSGANHISIITQDNHFVAVQQAQDSCGNWVSLEHFIHSECGNSYFGTKMTQNQYYVFKIAKYTGDYPTKLRLKALINNEVVYSNEFCGSMNYEQLNSIYNIQEDEMVFR